MKKAGMVKLSRFWIYLLAVSLFYSCSSETTEVEEIGVDFNNPSLIKILDFQHQQNVDSLLKYLDHPSANLRYHSALAFASLKDSTHVNPLSAYLDDPHPQVRAAVAFAIGQTDAKSAAQVLKEAFEPYDTAGRYQLAHSYILEGVGKSGDPAILDLLTGISTYQKRDTLLLEGQMRGIYRLMLKGITNEAGTQKMLNTVADEAFPSSVRLIAANYLYRARNINLESESERLGQLIFREKDPNIRMALAIALGKTKQLDALAALEQRFKMETDYRVKCNIVRALANFPYDDARPILLSAIKDPNIHVALTAAQFCRDNGDPKDAAEYWRLAKDSIPSQSVPLLYAAAQRHLPGYYAEFRQSLNGELRRRFRDTEDVYQQAAILEALAEFGWNYRFIQREGFQHESPVVRSKSVQLLSRILNRDDFRTFFGVNYRNIRRELAVFFKDAIRSNDPGMIVPAANSLEEIGQGPRDYLIKIDSSFIQDAFVQLDLPKDQAAFSALLEAAKRFRLDNIPEPISEEFSQAPDWEVLKALPGNPTATITTNKGAMTLALFPDVAPASVANFAKLAKEGFYQNIAFHRVVPNFVVQAGCDRGDGYGGVPYTIRSELNPVYYNEGGYLGMARSDFHTESSQFFITHSPTPHLDGGYTIFGKLTEGKEVLDAIIKGDRILSVEVK